MKIRFTFLSAIAFTAAVLSSCHEKIDLQSHTIQVVVTEDPSMVSYTKACLEGKIKDLPEGKTFQDAECAFMLSTDSEMTEANTVLEGWTSADEDGCFQYNVLRLLPETRYYCMAIAKFDDTTYEGGKTEFTTSALQKKNGYPYIDLGLNVCWAWHNIGASTPFETGRYYIDTFKADAGEAWGGGWRTPTKAELQELNTLSKTYMAHPSHSDGYCWFTSPVNQESILLQAFNDTDETGDDGYFSSEHYYNNRFYYGLKVHSSSTSIGSYIVYGACRPVFTK